MSELHQPYDGGFRTIFLCNNIQISALNACAYALGFIFSEVIDYVGDARFAEGVHAIEIKDDRLVNIARWLEIEELKSNKGTNIPKRPKPTIPLFWIKR